VLQAKNRFVLISLLWLQDSTDSGYRLTTMIILPYYDGQSPNSTQQIIIIILIRILSQILVIINRISRIDKKYDDQRCEYLKTGQKNNKQIIFLFKQYYI